MRIFLPLAFMCIGLSMARDLLTEGGLGTIFLQDGLDIATGDFSATDRSYSAILRILLLLLRLLPSDQVLLQLLDQVWSLVRPDAMYAGRTS